jgi:DNA-binding NtrC family response regulator
MGGHLKKQAIRQPSAALPNTAAHRMFLAGEPRPATRGKSILLVDNDPKLIFLKSRILQGEGYTVHGCRSAAEAARFFNLGSPIDLLLTDVHLLRGLSGVGLAERLVQVKPALRVLLMSGGVLNEYQEQMIRLHSWTCVDKPILVPTLLSIIESLVNTPPSVRTTVFDLNAS